MCCSRVWKASGWIGGCRPCLQRMPYISPSAECTLLVYDLLIALCHILLSEQHDLFFVFCAQLLGQVHGQVYELCVFDSIRFHLSQSRKRARKLISMLQVRFHIIRLAFRTIIAFPQSADMLRWRLRSSPIWQRSQELFASPLITGMALIALPSFSYFSIRRVRSCALPFFLSSQLFAS